MLSSTFFPVGTTKWIASSTGCDVDALDVGMMGELTEMQGFIHDVVRKSWLHVGGLKIMREISRSG